jgi:tRNA(Ile)-lysidine synthase TilS/MesJ
MNLNLFRYGRRFIASIAHHHLPQRGDKGIPGTWESLLFSEYSALVVVAMSGGVDSSVTAAFLAQKVI